MQPVETEEWKNEKYRLWSNGPTMITTEEEAINIRMENYGLFLNDGDFEKYQPCCYFDGGYTKNKWKKLKLESDKLYPNGIIGTIEYDRELFRITWIKGRFIIWFSDKWQEWQNKLLDIYYSHTIEEWQNNKFW